MNMDGEETLIQLRAEKEAKAKANRIRIGKELRYQRELCHYTTAIVATKVDINEVTVRNIEQGRFAASIDLLSKIASVYGCELKVCDIE